jgi:hypothetical protein
VEKCWSFWTHSCTKLYNHNAVVWYFSGQVYNIFLDKGNQAVSTKEATAIEDDSFRGLNLLSSKNTKNDSKLKKKKIFVILTIRQYYILFKEVFSK